MRRSTTVAVIGLLLLAVGAPAVQAIGPSPDGLVDGVQGNAGDRAITFVGVWRDRPDLVELRLGTAGFWFPQFAANEPVAGAPTGANVRDGLPTWVAAFNHTTGPTEPGCDDPNALARGCTPSYYFRTFSQDGPARSAGGHAAWSRLRLPTGECGTSGGIVDPQTFVADQDFDDPTGLVFPRSGEPKPNNNNTINRIQLQGDVPPTLYVSVVTDNTAGEHDPGRLEVRGNVGALDVPSEVADSQVEPTFPTAMALVPNGVPDVYVFRVDGFVAGDYLKLRLRGSTSPGSFGGLLFDTTYDPAPAAASNGPGRSLGADRGVGQDDNPGAGHRAGGSIDLSCP
jgi:hypothetical protein